MRRPGQCYSRAGMLNATSTRQIALAGPILGLLLIFISIPSAYGQRLLLPESRPNDSLGQLDIGLGFGQIDDDYFVRLRAGMVFNFDPVQFGIQVPLNFRVIDESPKTNDVVRTEDWDEFSDYLKLLRFVQWGRYSDPTYARIGELTGISMGHGTVVDRYYNVITVDNYKMGLHTRLDFGYGGLEFMADHVAPPNLVGLRGFIRPGAIAGTTSDILAKPTVGVFVVGDFDAPTLLSTRADGSLRTDTTKLRAAETGAATFYGLDFDWEVFANEHVALKPYFDLVGFNDEGAGTHLGLMSNFYLPSDVRLDTRIEWRFATENYQPAYFNPMYEVERFSFLGAPKLAAVRNGAPGGERHGFYGSIDLDIGGYINAGVTYEDYQGSNNSNFLARVSLPYIAFVKFAAFYTKRNFSEAADLGNLDNALLVALARFKIWGPLYASAEYARQWRLQEDGAYETTNNWNLGAGAEFTF